MEFRWKAKAKPNEVLVKQLSEAINVNASLAAILVQRGIENAQQAEKFFRPKLEDLYDPFLMKDMDKAIERIERSFEEQEKTMVYGDYDVDGTTAVSTVYSYFINFNQNMDYYIPDRYKEGYGISMAGIDFAHAHGFTLIIALDCGIRSNAQVAYAKSLGIDFIICDHHLPGDTIPDAVAVLDPKRKDCEYPYKELSGCGIGFKLIQAHCEKHGLPFSTIEDHLDLVAVSIASDMVDISDENRVLAYFGLKRLNENPRLGLQALMEGYARKDNYGITDIVFGIGPRINAAGRMADAKASVRVLIERDFNTAIKLSKVLHDHNTDRKELDTDITKAAIDMLENDAALRAKKSTVLRGDNWSKGVIGIVASRLIESYYKPTIIFSENEGMLTGSARSVKDFDIHEAIGACAEYVEQFGGHKYAAGLSIKMENFQAFADKFEQVVADSIHEDLTVPEIEYDLELNLDQISPKMLNIINQMSPFGPGNPFPVFCSTNLQVNGGAKILKEKHLKLSFKSLGKSNLDGIGFGLGHHFELVSNNKPFRVCYTLEENVFNGRTSIQLRLKDVKM